MKKICPCCGVEVSAQNLSRHLNRCNGDGFGYYKKITPPENLSCPFCGKLCKNLNSYRQHSVRCKSNPDRKAFDSFSNYIRDYRKGQTADTCPEVAKQVKTVKDKYKNGFVSPVKGRKNIFEYIYTKHNNEEISKWLKYVDTINLIVPPHETKIHCQGYPIVCGKQSKSGRTVLLNFEHDFVADLMLGGNLKTENTVHHINFIRNDNRKENLMIFESSDDHKRFHNSKYAYLTYNEETHLFSCRLKKQN